MRLDPAKRRADVSKRTPLLKSMPLKPLLRLSFTDHVRIGFEWLIIFDIRLRKEN